MNKQKKTITEILIRELPENYFGTTNLEKIIFKIWVTGRTGTGLRLTEEGFKAFTDAELAYYEYPLNLTDIVTDKSKLSLELDKKIKCPYYLDFKNRLVKNAYIRLYDSRDAMIISLYGNIKEFIENTKK